MTMTDERLAELDAVMANTTKREWSADGLRDNRIVWSGPDTRVCFMAIYPKAHADSLAIVALHNAYHDLRAHIDAQAATITRLREAMIVLRDDMLQRAEMDSWSRNGDIVVEAGAGAWSRFNAAIDTTGAA